MVPTALYTKKTRCKDGFLMMSTERLVLVRKCCKQHQLTSVTAVVTLKSIAVACFFTNNSVTCGTPFWFVSVASNTNSLRSPLL